MFGGYTIVFSGDFQQLDQVGIKNNEKIWYPSSSGLFESSINCTIILDVMHRFKDDTEYGNIRRRLCKGNLTENYIRTLSAGVIGRNNLELPKHFEGDICYGCTRNKERNSVTAAGFHELLKRTHPDDNTTSGDLAPQHIMIIKGSI